MTRRSTSPPARLTSHASSRDMQKACSCSPSFFDKRRIHISFAVSTTAMQERALASFHRPSIPALDLEKVRAFSHRQASICMPG
jgi:hypothetical protein